MTRARECKKCKQSFYAMSSLINGICYECQPSIETSTDKGTQFDGGGIKNDIKPEQIPY